MNSGHHSSSWIFGRRSYREWPRPLLMGIVNVTPDSFSDGGQFFDAARAVDQAVRLVEDGADLIDIGGESTRPGAASVSVEEELARVIPAIRALMGRIPVPISIDTSKAEVARQALAAGAEIVNDISGLQFDSEMPTVCADSACGVICMHIQGTPQTMQLDPRYDNVVADIVQFFRERLIFLKESGIPAERIMLDPGIGFGKSAAHNLAILTHISELRAVGRPILIGHSRKSFLKKLLGRDVDERAAGGLGISVALAAQGVECLRVHDVAAHRDAIVAWQTVTQSVLKPGSRLR